MSKHIKFIHRLSWLIPIIYLPFSYAKADELLVAVASNFSLPMQQIVKDFEEQYHHKVQLAFGSSGKFFAQISHGAPYDVFFSADQTKPQALIEQNLAFSESRQTYALGALALWSTQANKVDSKGQILRQGKFNKLALANPKLAPYGLAATDVLNNLHLLEQTRPLWVQGENIAQTYQFVASQNADMGFVAVSQIMQNNQLKFGSAWLIPAKLYRPIKQDAVILKQTKVKNAAEDLMQFMQSTSVQRIILSFGYQLDGGQS